MLILAADTSGKNGSLALASSEASGMVSIPEVVPLAGGTFSAQLIPQVQALLSRHGFSRDSIDGFAVVSGPGSFTGLRVGLAAIKGLAEVLGKPLVAISLLEAVAATAGESVQGRVLAVLDAGRGEAYVGDYEMARPGARLISQDLVPHEKLLQLTPNAAVVTPDSALGQRVREAGRTVLEISPPRADAIARMGVRKMMEGEIVAADQLEANYIRRSDAEIFGKPNL